MKNFVKWFGIIAFAAVMGLAFAACDLPKDELDGTTWKATYTIQGVTATSTVKFESPNFTSTVSYVINGSEQGGTSKGTYEISGSDVTLTTDNAPSGQNTAKGKLSGNKLTIGDTTYTKQ
jgi:hypothetical protein